MGFLVDRVESFFFTSSILRLVLLLLVSTSVLNLSLSLLSEGGYILFLGLLDASLRFISLLGVVLIFCLGLFCL